MSDHLQAAREAVLDAAKDWRSSAGAGTVMLRDDEIAYLGSDRCYCGHLDSLHDDGDGWRWDCLIDGGIHHFCSEAHRAAHSDTQRRIIGNPAVGRTPTCRLCREEGIPE